MLARIASASPACARAYTHPRAPTVVSVSISLSVSISVLPIPHPCILSSPPFVPTLPACPSVCATSCASYCLDPALQPPALMPRRIPMQRLCPSASPCPHDPASSRTRAFCVSPPDLSAPESASLPFWFKLRPRALSRLFHFNPVHRVLVLFALRYSLSATRPRRIPSNPSLPLRHRLLE
ncbi:hypothetical protein DFH09DRAFT_1320186 [Mycena vulgaris]|nr:hypothetical protein DFH09DRAFT_1320186 [Mycena vulgaris]